MERALELQLRGIAICDRNGVYGLPRAYHVLQQQKPTFPFRLISGAEVTLRDYRPSISFLATDRKGYGLLCRMLTQAHADKPKGEASLGWQELLHFLDCPESAGLLALPFQNPWEQEKWGDSDYETLKDLLGNRLYLPWVRALDGWDSERARHVFAVKKRLGASIVATNDVHYHILSRRPLQDVVTAIRHGTTLSNAGRKLFSNGERYLRPPHEMASLYHDYPEALSNTLEVAERCEFSLSELRYRYPSEWIPAGYTAQSFLEELTWIGATKRYKGCVPVDVEKQVQYELNLINQLGFADYFLTIWDIVEFARSKEILCQGRGSAANSVVCYCLGITAIDPVRMNLLFERFISVERGEPPDIDVDFEHERREEIIQYIYGKYGRDRAAMVSAVITYRRKLARRETRKAFGLSPDEESCDTRLEALSREVANDLRGMPRHLSIHSGGFTLSADPIVEVVPVEPARMEGRTIIQWDKYDLDVVGLLKVDLLSLGMLTAIHKTLDTVGLPFAEVPSEDPETYKMIQRGETVGVFQIESRAQMNMLGRLQPKTFYDLVVEVAIVRPGPIVGKMVHPYLKRRKGLEEVTYPHEKLKKILGKTLGVPLFQEQVMKIAIELGGFSPGEADELRRAIGAWRSSGSIHKMGQKLMEGLRQNGLPGEFAQRIYDQIQGFSQYGFPESHAASFALLAYVSAYLKCHYPAEFFSSMINSQPMGFYSNHTLTEEAKRAGVRILPVDPHASNWDCRVSSPGEIRLGWRIVHGMSEEEACRIHDEREKSPFTGLADFLHRSRLRRNVLIALALGDVFRCFGWSQRHVLWEILAYQAACLPETSGQLNLLAGISLETQVRPLALRPLDSYEAVRTEHQMFGLSAKAHPLAELRRKISTLPSTGTKDVKNRSTGARVRFAGMVIVLQRPATASGTVFATLEDEHGFVDVVLHRKIFARYKDLLGRESFFVASGVVQKEGYSVSVTLHRLQSIFDADIPAMEAPISKLFA